MKLRGNKQKRDKHTKYRPLLTGADLTIYTDSEKLELLKEVRKGNQAAIEKMILCHIRLAISLVIRFVGTSGYGYYINVLDSAAMEGVVVAVNRVASGSMAGHDNITGYIIIYVRQFIQTAASRSNAVCTPRNKKNKVITPFVIPELSEKDSQLGNQEFELWDTIDSLIDNETEKEILKLRQNGYTDLEIGKLIGLSRLQVLRIRHDLFQRYQRKVKSVQD